MTTLRLITATAAAALLMGCSAAKDAASDAATSTKDAVTNTAAAITPGADISAAPSGTYKSEQGHAYVAFTYSHQGYSKPILRWAETNATIVLDSENPENSTLTVSIPAASIDSGVQAFDEHLVGPDFFDVANHPTITFTSTDVDQAIMGGGSVTGDLTIKGVTKPFTMTGKVNKVGKHFRSKADMFGVSVTGKLKRSDFGVDKYGPMADDIEIMIEVEFQKEG